MSSRHPFFGQFPSAHRPPPDLFVVVVVVMFFLLPSPLLSLSSRTSVERSQLLARRHAAISSLAGRKELQQFWPSPPPQSVPINPTAQSSNASSNSPLNSLEEEQNIIQRLLHSENNAAKELYDWRVRPRGTMDALRGNHWSGDFEMPVMVDVNMYLRSISKVDDVNMEFTMHFTFRQEWTDERLFFHSNSLAYIVLISSEYSQRIFLPDTFFQNEKDGKKHDVDKPNVFIRVYNGTGRVLYSSRMTLTLSCPMHLQAYPLDTQTCFIDYASYAYTTKDLEYRWKADDPIQIKHGMRQSLPSFVLSAVTTANCTSVTNTGTYSCLRTIIRLRREFSYYLLQLYVPSFMLVAVSTVSFWLDKDSVPARITLGTTVLLTVTTMASGINAKLPPVSYTKSVDIWIGVCTGFIFAALLEFSLVNWAARKEASSMAKSNRRKTNPLLSAIHHHREHQRGLSVMDTTVFGTLQQFHSASAFSTSKEADIMNRLRHLSGLSGWWRELWTLRYREKSRRIDLLARVLFPLFFVIFNIIYWTCYLRPYLAEEVEGYIAGEKAIEGTN